MLAVEAERILRLGLRPGARQQRRERELRSDSRGTALLSVGRHGEARPGATPISWSER